MSQTTPLEIVEVDPADEATIAAWHAVYAASAHHELGPVAVPWQHEEVRALIRERGRRQALTAYAGLRDGDLVAAGMLTLPLLDNRQRAELDVHVQPEARRSGLGSQLLAHLEHRARAAGRTLMFAEASWPWAAGTEGAGRAGPEFARRHGYELGISDVQRMLELPVGEDRLAELDAAAAPHREAYEVRAWAGPVPEDLVRGWVELEAAVDTEAPVGGLDLEPRAADVAAYREDEALTARQGRTKINAVALSRAGEVVAYSDVATTVHEPERAYQWGTLVRRDHRGHRLGLALKLATLRLLQDGWPGVRQLMTYNAEVNGPMVAVNEQMGYRPVARLGELQKRLG